MQKSYELLIKSEDNIGLNLGQMELSTLIICNVLLNYKFV